MNYNEETAAEIPGLKEKLSLVIFRFSSKTVSGRGLYSKVRDTVLMRTSNFGPSMLLFSKF